MDNLNDEINLFDDTNVNRGPNDDPDANDYHGQSAQGTTNTSRQSVVAGNATTASEDEEEEEDDFFPSELEAERLEPIIQDTLQAKHPSILPEMLQKLVKAEKASIVRRYDERETAICKLRHHLTVFRREHQIVSNQITIAKNAPDID